MSNYFPLKKVFIFLPLFVFIFTSCELINPDETIPSYISIDKIILHTDYSSQGTDSYKITDAWVYVDDNFIGAFELPADFPVLETGFHDISIRPGIKVNGISSTRDHYAFYNSIEIQGANLRTEQTLYLDTLETTYSPITNFAWMEDFEDGGVSLEKTARSDTNIQKTSLLSEVFEGGYSGVIYLSQDTTQDFFELETSDAYPLPGSGSPVFLEFNYKCSNTFTVGIISNTANQHIQSSLLVINTSKNWNKIYVNLTKAVSRVSNALDFKIFFGGMIDADKINSAIYLDNIKLLHYK